MSAKKVSEWGRKKAIFAAIQYCNYTDKVGASEKVQKVGWHNKRMVPKWVWLIFRSFILSDFYVGLNRYFLFLKSIWFDIAQLGVVK